MSYVEYISCFIICEMLFRIIFFVVNIVDACLGYNTEEAMNSCIVIFDFQGISKHWCTHTTELWYDYYVKENMIFDLW